MSFTTYVEVPTPTPTPTPSPSASASPTTAPAASLAKTGAEVDWLSLGSLIAVVAGTGFFALGRRKRTE
jgi:LPXTG-motif cell wall-anchored protein